MEDRILQMKSYEYLCRVQVASDRHNTAKAKKAMGQLLVIDRMSARNAVEKLVRAQEAASAAERSWKKSQKAGILFPLGEQRIQKMKEESRTARKELAELGGNICTELDMWQDMGATLQELCNLCNRDYQQVLKELGPDHEKESFSTLACAFNLDYKDSRNRGWIDFDVDAPLTHAAKEYLCDLMLHTPEGKKAAHEALVECFPQIWDSRIIQYTDADGDVRFMDKDGVEVPMED